MNWLLLTLISVISASLAGILQKVLMRGEKSDPYAYAIAFHFLLGILNLIVALLRGFHMPSLSENILSTLLAAVLWGAVSILLFKAFQLLEASEVTILSTLGIIVTIVASTLFLNETFSLVQMAGAVLIIGATILISPLKKGLKINKGVLYVICMTILAGLAIVADSFNVQKYDAVSYNAIVNFLVGILLFAIFPRSMKNWKHFFDPEFLKKLVPLGILSTTQGIAYLLALSSGGNTAQVGTIRQSQVIITVILAIIFLKERSNLAKKLIAAIMVTCGVFLVG